MHQRHILSIRQKPPPSPPPPLAPLFELSNQGETITNSFAKVENVIKQLISYVYQLSSSIFFEGSLYFYEQMWLVYLVI